jgi:hypothetical protein
MADWIQCPHCQLRHRSRDNGLCPRCQQRVAETSEASPWTPPAESGAPGRYSPPDEGLGLAVRIAGVVLVLNAAANLAFSAFSAARSNQSAGQIVASSAIDLILGVLLIGGNAKVLPWAKVRAILGGVGFTAYYYLFVGDAVLASLQGFFSAGLVGLLLGRAGVVRTVVAAGACGVCLAAAGIGLLGMSTGVNPLARAMLSGEADAVPQDLTVRGAKFRYRIRVPNDTWCLRKAAAAAKDNPLADRWLVHPEQDAHVIVIGEQVAEGLVIDMKAFTGAVMKNAQRVASRFEIIEESPLANPNLAGRMVHTTATIDGLKLRYYYGLYSRGNLAFQVIAFAPETGFGAVQNDLKAIVHSFALDLN